MPSVSRLGMLVGLVLLVGGIAIGGWGGYKQVTDTCEPGYWVTITELDKNETVESAPEQVAYSNLSATEQRVFKEILTAETTPLYQNDTVLKGLTKKVVSYRGEQYEISPMFVSDCSYGWVIFKILGGLTALLGGTLVAATYGWRRFRT